MTDRYRKWTKQELGCWLGGHNPKRGVVLIPLLGERVMFPACKQCIGDLEADGHDVTKACEQMVREYMDNEPAFARAAATTEAIQ